MPFESDLFVSETSRTGLGLFTRRRFVRGNLVFKMTGTRRYFQSRTVADALKYENWLTAGRDSYLDPAKPYVYGNHSCDPCLGIRGNFDFIALRDIEAGSELTYDYSITTDELHWTMDCKCGSPYCRRTIRSIQFLPPKTYRLYLPYITPYLQIVYREAILRSLSQ